MNSIPRHSGSGSWYYLNRSLICRINHSSFPFVNGIRKRNGTLNSGNEHICKVTVFDLMEQGVTNGLAGRDLLIVRPCASAWRSLCCLLFGVTTARFVHFRKSGFRSLIVFCLLNNFELEAKVCIGTYILPLNNSFRFQQLHFRFSRFPSIIYLT